MTDREPPADSNVVTQTGPWTVLSCVTAACTRCGKVPLDEDTGLTPHFTDTAQASPLTVAMALQPASAPRAVESTRSSAIGPEAKKPGTWTRQRWRPGVGALYTSRPIELSTPEANHEFDARTR